MGHFQISVSDMVQIFHCICKSGFNLKEIMMKKMLFAAFLKLDRSAARKAVCLRISSQVLFSRLRSEAPCG